MSTETIDYFQLGARVRKYRRELGLTQDELAEKADISVTHMSHIETGNTKLSLEVLVKLAGALSVPADRLIFGETAGGKWLTHREIGLVLNDCESEEEARMMLDLMRNQLSVLHKYRRRP